MNPKLIFTLLGVVLVVGGLAYQFAALEIFNALVPKDTSSRLVERDVSFGQNPRQRLDIYAPTTGTGPWPVVIFIHGGSWSSGNKNPYEFVGRAFAAQGYLTLVPNYRLHPENKFSAFVEDAANVIDWATHHASEYAGKPSEIFVAGHSAGAYNAALAILDKHYLAVLGTDQSAIRAVALLAGPYDFLPLDTAVSISVFGKVPDLPSTQPINFARADAPPFLLLHGSADTTCLPRNSISLAAKLNTAGANASVKIYDGVSHVGIMMSLARPLRKRVPALADAVAFFQSHSSE